LRASSIAMFGTGGEPRLTAFRRDQAGERAEQDEDHGHREEAPEVGEVVAGR